MLLFRNYLILKYQIFYTQTGRVLNLKNEYYRRVEPYMEAIFMTQGELECGYSILRLQI